MAGLNQLGTNIESSLYVCLPLFDMDLNWKEYEHQSLEFHHLEIPDSGALLFLRRDLPAPFDRAGSLGGEERTRVSGAGNTSC